MRYCFFLLLLMGLAGFSVAHAASLRADFRHRPPEMVLAGDTRSGPIKDILEEAAVCAGASIEWRNAHFARSLRELENGTIDIIPRMVKTTEREQFTNYLGPLGYQERDILFLIKRGHEGLINKYEDLYGLVIEVKRRTAYFDRFDQDTGLKKHENDDDDNMVRMFKAGRFDTMPVLDKSSLEAALRKYGIEEYSYAKYKYINRIGNYYGMSKRSEKAYLFPQLSGCLRQMVERGRITAIYEYHGVQPPAPR